MRFYSKLKKRGRGKNYSLILHIAPSMISAYKIKRLDIVTLEIFITDKKYKEFSNQIRLEQKSLIVTVPKLLVEKYNLKQNKIYEFEMLKVTKD